MITTITNSNHILSTRCKQKETDSKHIPIRQLKLISLKLMVSPHLQRHKINLEMTKPEISHLLGKQLKMFWKNYQMKCLTRNHFSNSKANLYNEDRNQWVIISLLKLQKWLVTTNKEKIPLKILIPCHKRQIKFKRNNKSHKP